MKCIITPLMAFMITMLSACSSLTPNFEKPQVSVNSFKLLPGGSINPTFEIGLRVVNPNSIPLNLKGMSYTASIEGNKIFSGVANQLPIVPAYGEEEVKLNVQADLFGGIRLFADLMQPRKTPIAYTLKVKLDVGIFALPIHITREGSLSIPKTN
ncbi:MAG: LEA14-like dessication related protein [Paraglaciecola sp.]|jgi:LEA14-like dessication related protein